MRFGLIDLSNLFHRARYGASADPDEKPGLALLILFRSLRKLCREHAIDHLVFALDHGSWRHTVYPAYKSRRRLNQLAATPREQQEQEHFLETLNSLHIYLRTETRCTVLAAPGVEGDDFIARWITRHPDDEHFILSGDSDFVQLLSERVWIVDGINQRVIGTAGVVDDKGNPLAFTVQGSDGKIKVGESDDAFVPEAEWWRKALFIKLVRGDAGDSVFSAYPGVRYEGKKASIRAAWEDRVDQGYDWNNLMFQNWDKLLESGDTKKVRVIDEFRINERVIDLTKQPIPIMQEMDAAIDAATNIPKKQQIGMYFLRFCKVHDLPALVKEAADHVAYLNAAYCQDK